MHNPIYHIEYATYSVDIIPLWWLAITVVIYESKDSTPPHPPQYSTSQDKLNCSLDGDTSGSGSRTDDKAKHLR